MLRGGEFQPVGSGQQRRQEQRYLGKDDKQEDMRDIRQHKGHGPAENRLYGGGVARDALDDKEVEAYRRRDKTHFRHLDDQNAEPDGIKTQLLYDREKIGTVSRTMAMESMKHPSRIMMSRMDTRTT